MALPALDCRQVRRAADAFADGELSLARTIATRAHLARCPTCRRYTGWQHTFHAGTRRAVHGCGKVAPDFEHRVRTALEHERRHESAETVRPASGRIRFRRAWLLAAPLVGLTALAPIASNDSPATPSTATVHAASASPPNAWIDESIDAMIGQHRAPIPTTAPNQPFIELERQVGLPVHAPLELEQRGATRLAATAVALGDQRAAALKYRIAGHSCTLFLYDAARLPLRRSRYLSPKVVDSRLVLVGTRRGYALAAVEQRGLGYAIATDLDADTAAHLAAAIR